MDPKEDEEVVLSQKVKRLQLNDGRRDNDEDK